ncbi:hypothetical protein I316_04179 [Kwoniella heveanensis BCC8398]|uniref:Myb-like domain-containing protein n=1 Tax=Kwoniella heveanensis BCC8398 TaxID=1296120 RepID=A0A1B9GTC8_9TREE|nr:hypothetical protein I316_04179 [Kwoniella heveanensis BCC8398]
MDSKVSSTSSDTLSKNRKRSAHWTDEDTDTLVTLLLRHRDTGRTADNGFKPEIWQEAAHLLKARTHVGGPKTPDVCKSRWQRLQRDYKAAKDMQAMPGFSWDRENHRLAASAEAWEQAEKHGDAHKYRKIHLPCYDILAGLCVVDGTRPRPKMQKGRSSLGSLSNSSSMLSLSTTNNPNGAGPSQQPLNLANHGHGHMNHHTMGNIHGQPDGGESGNDANAMAQLQGQLQGESGVFNWGGNEAGDESGQAEFETSFTMHDGSQTFNLGQKRSIPFDPSILAGITTNSNAAPQNAASHPHTLSLPQQQAGSPPKKPRSSRQQSLQVAPQHPVRSQPDTQHPTQNQNHVQNHSAHQTAHALPPPQSLAHTHPQFYQMPSQPQAQVQAQNQASASTQPSRNQAVPSNDSNVNMNGANNGIVPRSPDFSNTPSLLESHVLQTSSVNLAASPGTANANTILRHFNPNTNSHTNATTSSPGLTQSLSLSSLSSLSAEVLTAGLTEAQRRTEAIIQLQNQENDNMSDQDLVEVMAEFEGNVAAADTYLAIKKEGLRKLWLMKIVKRRRK